MLTGFRHVTNDGAFGRHEMVEQPVRISEVGVE